MVNGMQKLTFKQYLDSKEQLLKAMDNVPVSTLVYEVKKYCSIVVGESEDNKEVINLKPKNKLIIEWQYDDIYNPTPLSIRHVEAKNSTNTQYSLHWPPAKLQRWLQRYTSEGTNYGQ